MYVPAIFALMLEDFHEARTFFYSATLGLIGCGLVGIAQGTRVHQQNGLRQLLALLCAFAVLPLLLAVPFYEGLRTTSFVNAYVEMVSAITTTGAPFFDDPNRLSPSLHLWRAQVGWMGGLLMWIAAAAILAPLNLGGFEVTASNEPGQGVLRSTQIAVAGVAKRIERVTVRLVPIYVGLTSVLWISLLIAGQKSYVALCHAMSVMATSGISPVGGFENAGGGFGAEVLVFLFMLFALSRLTFSTDTMSSARIGLHNDPEFRVGLMLILGVPALLFLRHWVGAYDVDEEANLLAGFQAFWGGMFTVLSFVTTTGFESESWAAARDWSGLHTPGLILMGLALIGGGVATTAGGVKLLRVYALYLNGMREIERLVHPSSVGHASAHSRRLRKQGAFVAWVFFMLFALTMAAVTVILAALGLGFEQALLLAISTLTTTGPLITAASDGAISLSGMPAQIKLVLAAAMVLGRLEMLAIIALFTPQLLRN